MPLLLYVADSIRHHFWERLMVNVGIVLVFAAFGLRFLKHT